MAFQQGLSGLYAASKALDVTSNNVANSATVGFKSAQAHFADVFAASLGGSGAAQVGIGVSVGAIQQQFTQGNITTTNNPLDISINGGGFYRMSNNGTITYSRAGQFHLDKEGYVIDDRARRLTGYLADATGTIVQAAPSELQLSSANQDPVATGPVGVAGKGVQASLNFDSRAIAPTAAFNKDLPATYNFSTATSIYDSLGNAHTLTIYASKITLPAVTASTAAATANTAATNSLTASTASAAAEAAAAALPPTGTAATAIAAANAASAAALTAFNAATAANAAATPATAVLAATALADAATALADAQAAAAAPNTGLAATAALSAATAKTSANAAAVAAATAAATAVASSTSDWSVYTSVDGTAVANVNAGVPQTISFDRNGKLTAPVGGYALNIDLGAVMAAQGTTNIAVDPLAFDLNFTGSTQFGAAFGTNSLQQNGYTSGRLTGVSVGADGVIRGNYSNGQARDLGQVVLTSFTNPNGLTSLGGNQWAETSASGSALVGAPNTGTLGVLQSAAIEESNVDLTAELVNMITEQRNYQANAQSIKTQDQIMQTLVNLR